MKNFINSSAGVLLRKKAKALHDNKLQSLHEDEFTMFDALKRLHELEIQQIELSIQNETLQAADEAAEKYTSLFINSPTAYFIISKEGAILNLNIAGAKIFDLPQAEIINK